MFNENFDIALHGLWLDIESALEESGCDVDVSEVDLLDVICGEPEDDDDYPEEWDEDYEWDDDYDWWKDDE